MGIYIIYVVQSPLMCVCIIDHSSANRSMAAHNVSSHKLPVGFSPLLELLWQKEVAVKKIHITDRADWGPGKVSLAAWKHTGLKSPAQHREVLCVCSWKSCAWKQQRWSFMFIQAHWIPWNGVPTALHVLPATPWCLHALQLPPPWKQALFLTTTHPKALGWSTSVQRETRPWGSSAGFITLKMEVLAFLWWR